MTLARLQLSAIECELRGYTATAAALRTLAAREAAQAAPLPAPRFSLVTGADFARSIRWHRTQPTLRDHLAPHFAAAAGTPQPELTGVKTVSPATAFPLSA